MNNEETEYYALSIFHILFKETTLNYRGYFFLIWFKYNLMMINVISYVLILFSRTSYWFTAAISPPLAQGLLVPWRCPESRGIRLGSVRGCWGSDGFGCFWDDMRSKNHGKPTKNDGTSPFLMGKSTISMAIFNSYVKLLEGKNHQT